MTMLYRKNNTFVNQEIGYVILSGNLDRDSYIQRCIRLGKVNVMTTNGTVYSECPVMNRDFSLIKFPEDKGKLGTAVVLIGVFGSTIPVVLGVLPNLDSYPYTQNEKQDVSVLEDENCAIVLDRDPLNGNYNLSIFGKKADKSNFNISVGAVDGNAKCNIDVQGEMKTNVTKLSQLNVEEEFEINIRNKEANEKFTNIKWIRETGLVITDEFDNKVVLKNEGSIIEVGKIRLGGKEGGTTLKEIFDDLFTAIDNMTLKTSQGPTVPIPINKAEFDAIKNKVQEFMEIN